MNRRTPVKHSEDSVLEAYRWLWRATQASTSSPVVGFGRFCRYAVKDAALFGAWCVRRVWRRLPTSSVVAVSVAVALALAWPSGAPDGPVGSDWVVNIESPEFVSIQGHQVAISDLESFIRRRSPSSVVISTPPPSLAEGGYGLLVDVISVVKRAEVERLGFIMKRPKVQARFTS